MTEVTWFFTELAPMDPHKIEKKVVGEKWVNPQA
jgi:hypothetical protein